MFVCLCTSLSWNQMHTHCIIILDVCEGTILWYWYVKWLLKFIKKTGIATSECPFSLITLWTTELFSWMRLEDTQASYLSTRLPWLIIRGPCENMTWEWLMGRGYVSAELWPLLGHCLSTKWYMSDYGTAAECCWQAKTEELGENCPSATSFKCESGANCT
jgi:hypothetical protein